MHQPVQRAGYAHRRPRARCPAASAPRRRRRQPCANRRAGSPHRYTPNRPCSAPRRASSQEPPQRSGSNRTRHARTTQHRRRDPPSPHVTPRDAPRRGRRNVRPTRSTADGWSSQSPRIAASFCDGLRGFSLQRTARGDYGDTHRANYGWRRQSTPAVASLLDVVSPHKSPGKHERHQDHARGDCFEILGEGRRTRPRNIGEGRRRRTRCTSRRVRTAAAEASAAGI